MKEYPARILFNVLKKEKTSIKNAVRLLKFPFNLAFNVIKKKEDDLRGPGIYFATFNGEIIYIGSYSSLKPNIVQDRWAKHIQTFTNRGYRLGFNAKTKKHLIPEKFMGFCEEDSFRYCDTGTVTSIERLIFAALNFDEFKDCDDNRILENFSFHYNKLEKNQKPKKIETLLIKKFKPLCNSSQVDLVNKQIISVEEVVAYLFHLLKV